MPTLTISAAARHCGVDRRTLQRAIASGRLTRTASGQVTLDALTAAGYRPAAPHQDAAGLPQGERPDAAGLLTLEAFAMAGNRPAAPQGEMPGAAAMPPELVLATTLLAHLAELTSTIAALHQEVVLLRDDLRRPPQRRRSIAPQDAAGMADAMPQDAAPVPHHDTLTPQETPQDAADTPQPRPATPVSPTPLPPHVLKVAEVAAQYDKLSLAELAELLYHRGVYRAKDRTTGADKPLNRGTLKKWLDMARAAGVL